MFKIQVYRCFSKNVWGGQRLQKKIHIICLVTLHVIKKMRSSGGIKTGGNRRESYLIKKKRKLYEFQIPPCPYPIFLSQPENPANPSSDPKIPNSISQCPWKRFCSSGLNPPARPRRCQNKRQIASWLPSFAIPSHRTGPDTRNPAAVPDAQKGCLLMLWQTY